ncbi:hypothetical protein [Nitrosopumilus sp.]
MLIENMPYSRILYMSQYSIVKPLIFVGALVIIAAVVFFFGI